MTFDDVVREAKSDTTRVPLYAIGLGERVNAQELARFAEHTGGQSLLAPTPAELEGLFQTIANQLKNQYVVRYTSNNVSGPHSLVVQVEHQGIKLQDERGFPAPKVPPTISFTSPAPDQDLSGIITTAVKVTSQGEVAVVKYYVNDELQSEATTAPYGFTWDTSGLAEGTYTLRAEVYDSEGQTGADEITIGITVPLPPPEEVEPPPFPWGLVVLVAALVVGTGGVGAIFVARRRRVEELEFEEEFVPEFGDLELDTEDIIGADETRDVSIDLLTPVATLSVVRSIELSPGEEFKLRAANVKIGRHPDNTIVIPDQPVSRWHAELTFEAGEFRIYDAMSKYGTTVNGQPVPREGTTLKDGDQIQLGTRTVLEFRQVQAVGEEPTGEETLDIGEEEETRDVGEETEM